MRLPVVFLFITMYLTHAKRSKGLKGVKNRDPSLVDDFISRADTIEDSKRYRVVPFGHIFRNGFNPNRSDPVDFLELESVYVKDSDLVQQLIKSGYKDIVPIEREKPRGFLSPRDEIYFNEKEKEENLNNTDDKFWHDYVGNQRRNINISPLINKMPNLKDLVVSRQKFAAKPSPSSLNIDRGPKHKYFDRSSFNLVDTKKQNNTAINWTTCDEFRRKADFHPKDVVNIDWVPFYVWSEGGFKTTSTVHRFSYPTKKLVQEYKDTYLPYINRTIDWDQPKLVLNETREMLLIAGDRRGLFTAIPHIRMPQYVPANAEIPTFQIRMKTINSYLALMMCDHNYAVIMAVAGSEPKGTEIFTQAAILKFKGTGTPVERDLELEKEIAEMERLHKLKMEKEKFIE